MQYILGNLTFSGFNSFLSKVEKYEPVYSKVGRISQTSRLQHVSDEPVIFAIEYRAHAGAVNVDDVIGTFVNYTNNGVIVPFSTGTGELIGSFVVCNLSIKEEIVSPSGRRISSLLSFELKEYVDQEDETTDLNQLKSESIATNPNALDLVTIDRLPINPGGLTVESVNAADANVRFIEESVNTAFLSPSQAENLFEKIINSANSGISYVDQAVTVVESVTSVANNALNLATRLQDMKNAFQQMISAIQTGNFTNILASVSLLTAASTAMLGDSRQLVLNTILRII